MNKLISTVLWLTVAALGAGAYATIALKRGEPLNSIYLLVAALCTYAIGFRFYSKWIAAKVMMLDDRRATPCEVHEDGHDFVKTNKWIVFGHHFAAISGPGPLVGPVLAAQFGYLPGTLWILTGVVLGGAVQDFVILFCSMRRNGRSLGQMVKEELNSVAGVIGLIAILAIMIILLAVLALVVVKALAESPWGVFTVAATIPIAMFMGGYLRWWRVGKVMEVSIIGVVLLLLAVWGGQFVHGHAEWSKTFTLKAEPLAWSVIIYGFAASVLPVWLLLAPRDYLSTFMKLGTIFALAVGVFLVLPDLKMPPISKFVDGSGLVVAGALFPFCFITIACGAISGFHTLISSGITPKIITRESYARSIGYGAMCLESLVAIMAMIAACTLDPGVYLSMNVKGAGATPEAVAADTIAKVEKSGFTSLAPDPAAPGKFKEMPVTVSASQMTELAKEVGEHTLYGRTGGAATLAVGMANIFSKVTHGRWLDIWYHFAIMFEALFILTTLDAGTRVGRYLIQDALGHVWKPLGDTKALGANIFASALVVMGWGYFLIQGVRDPLGGINSLWPLFGIANQLLASIALCLATTVILKLQLAGPKLSPEESKVQNPVGKVGNPAYALVTLIPLIWLLSVTLTAGYQKIWHPKPSIGFLAAAEGLEKAKPDLEKAIEAAKTAGVAEGIAKAETALRNNRTLRFNNQLNAVVAGTFMALVIAIVLMSVYEWLSLLAKRRSPQLSETEPVWLPAYAVAEGRPVQWWNIFALGFLLLKELSGEAAVDRAQACIPRKVDLLGGSKAMAKEQRAQAYVAAAEKRFDGGPNRCC
ncbi:MAG: carbon starvation protein A [Proteobacteria bacterium]|nr:carbon starvation protein A [Verrucomicrobiota bacterium]NBU11081.1 carbon starvation protein A [Pseudomonadota bacterium]